MKKRVLKKPVIYVMYGLVVVLLIGSVFLIERTLSNNFFQPNNNDDYVYVSRTIFDDTIPVVSTNDQLIKPYTDEQISILRGFYDYKADAESQEKSIIFYSDQYLQNSGVSYGGVDNFDVISIYDGTVVEVKEDNLLGNIIEIRHSNDLISVYQSLSEILVNKDDEVKQGTVIGKSGTSNIGKNLENHLHFELIYKGESVNPEQYYDKRLDELE